MQDNNTTVPQILHFDANTCIEEGATARVYLRHNFPLVAKIPRDANSLAVLMQTYAQAANSLGDLVVPYTTIPYIFVKGPNIEVSPFAIIQERATEYFDFFEPLSLEEKVKRIKEGIQLDRKIMRRNVYIFDTYFKNLGFYNNELRLLDVGSFSLNPFDAAEYIAPIGCKDLATTPQDHQFLSRGAVIYNRYWETGLEPQGEELRAEFISAIQLPIEKDYVFGLSNVDCNDYQEIFCEIVAKSPKCFEEVKEIVLSAANKPNILFRAAQRIEYFREEFVRISDLIKNHKKFIEIGRLEFERHYGMHEPWKKVELSASAHQLLQDEYEASKHKTFTI